MLERYIEGFLNHYSPEAKDAINEDLSIIEKFSFYTAKPHSQAEKPTYLATAGGPGTLKTTTLETFLRENNLLKNYVYADPDQVSLKNMIYTYRTMLTNFHFAAASSNHTALKQAYDYWRDGSNYICQRILQRAFKERYSVAHGTTSTSPHILSLYENLKTLDYRIVLLLCYNQEDTRKQAIFKRENEQAFVQADPNDVINKGIDFPKRFDIYFHFADEIFFYWNNELIHGKLPQPCAQFNNSDQTLTILNEPEWFSFCRKYLQDTQNNGIEICKSFEQLIPTHILDEERSASHVASRHPSTSQDAISQSKESAETKEEPSIKSNASFRFLSKPNKAPVESNQHEIDCGFKPGLLSGKKS